MNFKFKICQTTYCRNKYELSISWNFFGRIVGGFFDNGPSCVQCARTHRWLLNNHYALCNILGKSVISWSSKWSRLPFVQAQSSFIPEFWQNRGTKNMDKIPDKTTEVGLISVIFFKIFVCFNAAINMSNYLPLIWQGFPRSWNSFFY